MNKISVLNYKMHSISERKKKKVVENWFKEVQNMKDEVVKMEGEVRKRRFLKIGVSKAI